MPKFSNKKNKRTKNNKKKPTTKIYKSKEQKANKEQLEKGTFALRVTPFFAFPRFCHTLNTVSEDHCRFVSQALGIHCERPKLGWNKRQRSGQE